MKETIIKLLQKYAVDDIGEDYINSLVEEIVVAIKDDMSLENFIVFLEEKDVAVCVNKLGGKKFGSARYYKELFLKESK